MIEVETYPLIGNLSENTTAASTKSQRNRLGNIIVIAMYNSIFNSMQGGDAYGRVVATNIAFTTKMKQTFLNYRKVGLIRLDFKRFYHNELGIFRLQIY